MQKPSANAGMGVSLGGGAAESAFGSDTTRVLTRWTVGGIVTFFIAAFALSMMHIHANYHKKIRDDGIKLQDIFGEDMPSDE